VINETSLCLLAQTCLQRPVCLQLATPKEIQPCPSPLSMKATRPTCVELVSSKIIKTLLNQRTQSGGQFKNLTHSLTSVKGET
jgi:hypothetical protein